MQIAKEVGARVTGVCSGRNAEFVLGLGADEVLDYTFEDVTAGAGRFDVIFDAVNAYPFWRWRRALKPGGTVVTVNPFVGRVTSAWLTLALGVPRLQSIFG